MEKTVKNGFKLLSFPKTESKVIEVQELTNAECDKHVGAALLKEVANQEGNRLDQVLILYTTKDGGMHWVGNQPSNAEQNWLMEQIKVAMLDEDMGDFEETPEPPKKA